MAHVLRLLLIACVVVRCMDLMGGDTAHERCSVVHVSSRRYGRDAINWPSPKGLDVQMLGIPCTECLVWQAGAALASHCETNAEAKLDA